MAGKYKGFEKLKADLADKSGVKDATALAATIGRKRAKRHAKRAAHKP